MSDTDLQLLARYTRQHAEDAFAEIVRRHVNLVYSAALRQVRSPQLAEEVAQSAFADLARNADRLARGGDASSPGSLTPWLYQVTRRTAIDVVRREARRQLREQIATEMNATNETAHFAKYAGTPDWMNIEPLLDEAMSVLDETDRAAVLLRYFENKSLREVGRQLGVSDDAAQKRVSRAVERLRESFAKRGVTVGASGLVVVISANAVQAAPGGLALTISTATALAGTTLAATASATTIKTVAMTTLQKTLVTATVAVLASVGIYEARQATQLRDQVQAFRQQQAPLKAQLQESQLSLAKAKDQINGLQNENERLNFRTTELLRLRGEVARSRSDLQVLREASQKANDPAKSEVEFILGRMKKVKQGLEQTADKNIPETRLLSDENWLHISQRTRNIDLETDAGMRESLSYVRELAKQLGVSLIQHALASYTKANDGQLPTDVLQLKPYLQYQVDDSILAKYETMKEQTDEAILTRYRMMKSGNVSTLQRQETVMVENAVVDEQIDTLWKIGLNYASWEGTGKNKGRTGTISSVAAPPSRSP
jgi:RNA polymerase sigma factor (sigma-70 family)